MDMINTKNRIESKIQVFDIMHMDIRLVVQL